MTKRIRTYVLLLITLFTFCGCYDPTPYLGTWVTDIEEEDGYDGTLKLMLKEDDNMVIELQLEGTEQIEGYDVNVTMTMKMKGTWDAVAEIMTLDIDPNSLITRVDDVSSSNSYANLFLNAYLASASNRLALEKELEREFKYEIDDMNGDVDILSVSPTKMEWKYDDGDQRFDDLSGCLSGDHLEMTFANGSSSVSLDIVSDGKMTGTIEGDEVTLHFTTQHS